MDQSRSDQANCSDFTGTLSQPVFSHELQKVSGESDQDKPSFLTRVKQQETAWTNDHCWKHCMQFRLHRHIHWCFYKEKKKKQKMFIAKATHIDRTLDRTLIIQKCWCLTAKKKREKCLSSSSTCKCRNWVSKLLFCVGGAKHDVHLLDGRLKTD